MSEDLKKQIEDDAARSDAAIRAQVITGDRKESQVAKKKGKKLPKFTGSEKETKASIRNLTRLGLLSPEPDQNEPSSGNKSSS